MNSLDDLRTTLNDHAHDLDGLDPLSRSAGIRTRIAQQRRRRNAVRGGVAVAAVAAVVGGVVFTDLGSGPTPDPAAALGAPESFTALGWTYALADAVESDESSQTIFLPANDRPYLLSWMTDGEGQDVTVTSDTEDLWHSSAADWADYVVVPAGVDQEVTVSAGDDVHGVAVATYEIDPSKVPAGQGSDYADAFHFREKVAGRVLVDASVAEGRNEDSFDYELPGETATLTYSCSGFPEGAWLRISLDGSDKENVLGEGCDGNRFDPGAGSAFSFDVDGDRVRRLGTVRMWVSRSETDPTPVAASEVTGTKLGAGLYSSPSSADGWPDADELVEHAGHTWQLDAVIDDVEPGLQISLGSLSAAGAGPRLLQIALEAKGGKRAFWTDLQINGESTGEGFWSDGTGTRTRGSHLLPVTAETVGIKVARRGTASTRHSFVFYRLAD